MCLTAHFVDENWKLASNILSFCRMKPPHTGFDLEATIFNCLKQWGIDKRAEQDELISLYGFIGQQMYDTDRSGCITKEEVASMLRALPEQLLQADITEPGKLDEIFDKMDVNSDGKVTFDEFKAAMLRDSSLQDVVISSLPPL